MRANPSYIEMATTPISPSEPTPLGAALLYEFVSDRRVHRRYPIILEVEYKLLKLGRVIEVGSGRTLNISTGGILFEANNTLHPSRRIELTLRWPMLLDGVFPMKLVIQGSIKRNDGNRIAMSTKSHEFHMARASVGRRIAQQAT